MSDSHDGPKTLYVECLTRLAFPERYRPLRPSGRVKWGIVSTFRAVPDPFRLELPRRTPIDRSV